jgi:predicted DNA-binding protein
MEIRQMPATVVFSLRLPVGVYEQLKAEAARTDQDIAQILRAAALAYLAGEENVVLPDDPIWRLPEIARDLGGSGIADGAVHHDEHLYGRGTKA